MSIEAIRQILGMRPDHATEAIDHLEVAEEVTNHVVRTEELTKALIHSNLALVEALTLSRRDAAPVYNLTPNPTLTPAEIADEVAKRISEGWAGMRGHES